MLQNLHSIAASASPTSPTVMDAPTLLRPSQRLCEGVSAAAATIETIMGPMPNTSIVISDNLRDLQSYLIGAMVRGVDLSEAVERHTLASKRGTPKFRENTQGFAWATVGNGHAVIGLGRAQARAICNPRSRRHIWSLETLAHEMGHVRAHRAGYDLHRVVRGLPRRPNECPEAEISEASVSEYLAVRAQIDVIDKLYGEGLNPIRASSFAKTFTKNIATLGPHAGLRQMVRPGKKKDIFHRLGYGIGTLNGYLDGFRAAQSGTDLPVRPDQLPGIDARAAKVLNATRGGLASLHRSLEASGTPEPLLQRAEVEHRRAIENARAMIIAPRKTYRAASIGVERD